MDALAVWLKATALSQSLNATLWVWPACETLHFIGLTLVIGIAGFFDLRLMGFLTRVPVSAARQLMPFAMFGFLINLVTGAVFVIMLPEQYVNNGAFWAKLAFLTVAGVNALMFEVALGTRTLNLGAGEDTPAAAKAVGAISLIAWFGVLYWGRMLPYLGDAF
jgi:hypothetical protein